jgi:predicted aconitase with swiveling domain
MILQGEVVVEGEGAGPAMVCNVPLAFGLVDPASGIVKQPDHPWQGRSIAGQVLVFPTGTGSASGSYWLLNLASEGHAPAAILNAQADAVVIAGAVLAAIPLLHRIAPDPAAHIRDGDRVRVDANGSIEIVAS